MLGGFGRHSTLDINFSRKFLTPLIQVVMLSTAINAFGSDLCVFFFLGNVCCCYIEQSSR